DDSDGGDEPPSPSAVEAAASRVKPKAKHNPFLETEAQESDEDEGVFARRTGPSDDDDDSSDDDEALVYSGDEDVVESFDDIIQLAAKQDQVEGETALKQLMRDLTTGELGRRRRADDDAKGLYAMDSDEENALLREKLMRRHWFTRRDAVSEMSALEAIATHPETAAFAKAFEADRVVE
ncbi:hypothetical protein CAUPRSCDRAFT_13147, partial [Caulochytrium protostelioides]